MNDLAAVLHDTGKAHAEAACLLYRASYWQAEREGVEDRAKYAFNGPYSLSVQYLLGLGVELMLKSIISAADPEADAQWLQDNIGHDLVAALDQAELRGFETRAANLRELVELLREPYRKHWFRYKLPPQMNLAGDFDQIVEILTILEGEARKFGIGGEVSKRWETARQRAPWRSWLGDGPHDASRQEKPFDNLGLRPGEPSARSWVWNHETLSDL